MRGNVSKYYAQYYPNYGLVRQEGRKPHLAEKQACKTSSGPLEGLNSVSDRFTRLPHFLVNIFKFLNERAGD